MNKRFKHAARRIAIRYYRRNRGRFINVIIGAREIYEYIDLKFPEANDFSRNAIAGIMEDEIHRMSLEWTGWTCHNCKAPAMNDRGTCGSDRCEEYSAMVIGEELAAFIAAGKTCFGCVLFHVDQKRERGTQCECCGTVWHRNM